MVSHVNSTDFAGASSYFSDASSDNYLQTFPYLGTDTLTTDISQIGTLTPVFINDDTAKYYFEQSVGGHLLLFPVEFDKENGVWKILEF